MIMRLFHLVLMHIILIFAVFSPFATAHAVETVDSETEFYSAGYAIVMANGTTLRVSEYVIDPDRETVYFKSLLSGLSATFPLERITRVVSYNLHDGAVPEDAMPLFIPERTVNEVEDDGGIPVVFNVTRTVVGSGGGTGYSRAGGDRPADYRQGYTPARTTGQTASGHTTTGPTQGRPSSSSASQTRTPPTNRPSNSSNSAADNFFDALFGGRR